MAYKGIHAHCRTCGAQLPGGGSYCPWPAGCYENRAPAPLPALPKVGQACFYCYEPAVYLEPPSGGLPPTCERCSPGGCQVCRAFARPCCREHREEQKPAATPDPNQAAARARGFRPELKVVAGQRPAFTDLPTWPSWDNRVRCELCWGGGAAANGGVCSACSGEGWKAVIAGPTPLNDLGEDPTQLELPVVPEKEVA